jgi:hypothetical protein
MPTPKPTPKPKPTTTPSGAPSDWEKKRRLAEIFGDVLPTTTRDEREETLRERGQSTNDAWLKSQVPPHHVG